jgi:hypothetical protein
VETDIPRQGDQPQFSFSMGECEVIERMPANGFRESLQHNAAEFHLTRHFCNDRATSPSLARESTAVVSDLPLLSLLEVTQLGSGGTAGIARA